MSCVKDDIAHQIREQILIFDDPSPRLDNAFDGSEIVDDDLRDFFLPKLDERDTQLGPSRVVHA